MSEQAPIDLAAAASSSVRSGASSVVGTVQQYARNRNVQIGAAIAIGSFAFYWYYCRPLAMARRAREAAVDQVAALPAGVQEQQFVDDDQGQTLPDAVDQQTYSSGEYENPEIGGYEPYAQ